MLLQILFNGLIAGSIYALVAVGFSLIYSVCKFINLAHGAVVALSGYILYALFSMAGLNFWLSATLTIVLTATIGLVINLGVYKQLRIRKASPVIMLVASIALLILIESLILMFFGADVKTIGFIQTARGIEVLDAVITPLQILIVVASLAIFAAMSFLMKKTKTGKAMRAVADNKSVAEIVGISSEKIYSRTFIISAVVAAVAGILTGLEQNLEPTMGTNLVIKGFTGSVIGGIGNVPGAVLGSFLLGFAENFGIWFLPSGYKDAIAFVILFIFLIFRHHGILGIRKEGDR